VVAKAKGQQPEGLSEWLENELRDTKARLHKVESELEQALKHSWSLESEIRKIHETMTVSGSAVSQLSAMREELRQVRDQLSKAQDRQAAIANRTEEVLRQRQADSGRDKQELSTLAKQIEGLSRGVGQFDDRLKSLEESVRRSEDGVSAVRLGAQAIERQFEDVAMRGQRSLEAAVRLEQDVARVSGDIESLRKIDAELDDKIRLILEGTRRSSERLDKLDDIRDFPAEARELIQRANAERDQIAQRIALAEKLGGELAEELQQMTHHVAKIDQRQQVQNAQIMDLMGRVQETAEQLQGQVKRIFQVFMRQRRRQMDTLAQEIKELGQGEHHGGEKPSA
jgi:chromosome segregation protein